MGRLEKGIHFSGTIGDFTFYQRWGTTYVRSKGSVTRERVLKSKEYSTTRQFANKMGLASKIASPVYRALPADRRARWVFRTITGDAASLLYKGMNEKEVSEVLWKKYIEETECNKEGIKPSEYNPFPSTKESKEKLRKLFLARWQKGKNDLSEFKNAWRNPRSFDPESIRRLNLGIGWLNF